MQENAVSHAHQSTSVSAVSTTAVNTVTTTSSCTVTSSVEPPHNACSKVQSKTACSQRGTESTVQKSRAVCCAGATTTDSHVHYSSQPVRAKLPSKQQSESQGRDKPSTDKAKTSQPSASSSPSSLTTDTSPQISVKLAKGRRCHKIGRPQDGANLTQQSAGQKSNQLRGATSSCSSLSLANGTAGKHGGSVGSHTSHSKLLSASQVDTSSKLIAHLPNGLVAHTKTSGKTDHPSQTIGATQHGTSAKPLTHLPNGLQAHADKNCAKASHLSQNGSHPQRGSKLGTEATNGSCSLSAEKASRKNENVAGTHLEQNGHVRASKPSEACDQSSSSMDVSGEVAPVNGHSDQNAAAAAAAAATKSKKARRKGRGKEALTSVG